MTSQVWHTMLVRVWRDHDGLKIRFLEADPERRLHIPSVETTTEDAVLRFAAWLRAAAGCPVSGQLDGAGQIATLDVDATTTQEKTPNL